MLGFELDLEPRAPPNVQKFSFGPNRKIWRKFVFSSTSSKNLSCLFPCFLKSHLRKRERGKKYRENRKRKRQEERNEEGMTERLYKVREEWKMCSWEIERKIFSWKDWRRKKWERVWERESEKEREREKGKIKFNRISLNSIFEVFLLTVKLNTGVIPSKLIQFNFNWF